MDSLSYVERDNGEKYYCFIDFCNTILPDIPKSTVRNWLKSLSIATVTCVAEERSFFRKRNPSLGGTFGLIQRKDLLRLIDYRSDGARKRPRLSSCATATNDINAGIFPSTEADQPCSSKSTNSSTGIFPSTAADQPCSYKSMNSSILPNIVNYSESSDEESQSNSVPAKEDTCQYVRQDINIKVESREVDISTIYKSPKKSGCQLSMDDAPENLKNEVRNLRNFYAKELNPYRKGGAYSPITIEKLTERVMCFMYYCKNVRNISDLCLNLFNNVDIYTQYLEHLKGVRKLKPSTIVAHIIICINVVKYNLVTHEPANTNPGFSREVQAYQSFQRQFQRESSMLAKCSKEGLLTTKASQQFYFAHILDTLRNIRDKYFEASGMQKLRHLHDFVLLATYLRAIPGRSKELRTMRLYVESEENKPFNYASMEPGNFIIFEQDERVVIVQFDFKTAKSIGPTKVDVSEDSDLVYYLQLYTKARTSLLLGKVHEFFFLNKNGAPFASSSAIAKYLGDIFQREVAIRASTNALRHAIVTYFSSLEESKDLNVRKSLALLMKHSVRHQELTYNDLTHSEKTKSGRALIREKLASNIFGESDCVIIDHSADSNSEHSSSDELELKPAVGDIVALIDPISTENNIKIFLAKVARFTQNRKEAHLMHLEYVEESANLYRLKPGKTWKESLRALVFPIDIIYNPSSQAYELRTSPRDIFNIVHGRE